MVQNTTKIGEIMDKKEDRRIDKTKSLIENTLIELLKEKSFNKITIKDLTERANIGRGTFYIHYSDKYDMLEQIEDNIISEMKDMCEEETRNIPEDTLLPSNKKAFTSLFIKIYTCISNHSEIIQVLLGPNSDMSFTMKIKNFVKGFILKQVKPKLINNKIPFEYLQEIAISLHLSIITRWLKNGMKELPEELAAMSSKIASSVFNEIFNNM